MIPYICRTDTLLDQHNTAGEYFESLLEDTLAHTSTPNKTYPNGFKDIVDVEVMEINLMILLTWLIIYHQYIVHANIQST